MGSRAGMVADARHVVVGDHREDRQPDKNGRAKAPVQLAQQQQRRQSIDRDVPDHLQQRDHELARRLPGLPDLGRNAAREFVVEEGDALVHDPLMRLPAHAGIKAGHHGLLFNACGEEGQHRAQHQHDGGHAGEKLPVLREEVVLRRGLQQIDDDADETVEPSLHQSCCPAQQQHGHEGPGRLAHEEPQIGTCGDGQFPSGRRNEGVDPAFKATQNSVQRLGPVSWCPLAGF